MKRKASVIGGGIFGLWTAVKLIHEGFEVSLIDMLGSGNMLCSSCDLNRVIRSFYGGDTDLAGMVRDSFDDWKWLETQSKKSIYTETGAMWMVQDGTEDSYPAASLPVSLDLGLHAYSIPVGEAQLEYPQVCFDSIDSIYFEERAGYLNAHNALLELFRLFHQSGGCFYRDHVKSIEFSGSDIRHVSLEGGQDIAADHFYFCCGPWINELIRDNYGYEIVSVSRQEVMYFSHPRESNTPAMTSPALPVWIDMGERIHYGIPGSRVTGFKLADDSRGNSFSPSRDDRNISSTSIEKAREFLRMRFPSIADQPYIGGKVCQYSNTQSGNYIIDYLPDCNNGIVCAAGNGHGFKNAPAIASQAIAMTRDRSIRNDKFQLLPISD